LSEKLNATMILNTLSENGIFIFWKENDVTKAELLPAHRRDIADVSGAGDTVISVASLCLASKLGAIELALLSNIAGGLVCEEAGVIPVNKEKFMAEAIRILNNRKP